eukprot:365042-Chlamydomonas_euryale.AAC.44
MSGATSAFSARVPCMLPHACMPPSTDARHRRPAQTNAARKRHSTALAGVQVLSCAGTHGAQHTPHHASSTVSSRGGPCKSTAGLFNVQQPRSWQPTAHPRRIHTASRWTTRQHASAQQPLCTAPAAFPAVMQLVSLAQAPARSLVEANASTAARSFDQARAQLRHAQHCCCMPAKVASVPTPGRRLRHRTGASTHCAWRLLPRRNGAFSAAACSSPSLRSPILVAQGRELAVLQQPPPAAAPASAHAYLSQKTESLRPSSSCSCHAEMAACAASVAQKRTVPKPLLRPSAPMTTSARSTSPYSANSSFSSFQV